MPENLEAFFIQQPPMLSSTTFYVGFNNLHVDFNNPTTTPKIKTQRKTTEQSKPQLVEDDPCCGASTTTIR